VKHVPDALETALDEDARSENFIQDVLGRTNKFKRPPFWSGLSYGIE
jgi:hypothetical protein